MDVKKTKICNWCGQQTLIIWVHGHGQCAVCGINIDECCRGEETQPSNFSLPVRQISNEDERENEKEKK